MKMKFWMQSTRVIRTKYKLKENYYELDWQYVLIDITFYYVINIITLYFDYCFELVSLHRQSRTV